MTMSRTGRLYYCSFHIPWAAITAAGVICHIFAERALCETGDIGNALIHHIPEAQRQMSPVAPMDLHTAKAIAVKFALFLTGAKITAVPNHLQKLLFESDSLFFFSLPI